MNAFVEVFSLLLRKILNYCCESQYLYNEYQFRFRNCYNTTDCIYLLNDLISNVLHNK